MEAVIDPWKAVSRHVARVALAGAALLASAGGAGAQSPAFLVRDINARFAPQSSTPSQFVARGDTAFFTASTWATGTELWRSDGSAAGTMLVKDINPGEQGSSPSSLTVFDGAVFFFASAMPSGLALWRSDGTEAGTQLVRDLGTGVSSAYGFTALRGMHFFAATGTRGPQLWRTDGTRRGTVALKTFDYPPTGMIAIDRTLFFRIDGYGHYGQFLWKSDGTTAGTVLVKAFNRGFDISIARLVSPLVEVGGRVLLLAGPGGAMQLWSSDGTDAGTVVVREFSGGSRATLLTAVDDRAFFFARTPEAGIGLWQTDGTDAGTTLVSAVPASFDTPSQLVAADGMLFFDASDGAHGAELWRSDGTAAGTALVRDIHPGSDGSYPSALTTLDGTLYFAADDGAHGTELWRSDGTADGTILVRDIASGSGGSAPAAMASLNGALLFAADDGAHGAEPWRSDGTASGTALVQNIAADDTATAGSAPIDLADVGGVLVFRADDGIHGAELWRSDGTADGTALVTDINPGPAGSTADTLDHLFGVIDGSLYFLATDVDHGVELWKTDGSPQGTGLLSDIAPGPASSYPFSLVQVDGALLFDAGDDSHGRELWTSDGTADGTRLLRDLNPGPPSSYPQDITNVNGTLFFRAVPELHGGQLWRTDGSAAGTVLLKSFSGFFQIWSLVGLGGRLVFTADDGAVGAELWGSDGTAEGTVLLADIVPGAGSSFPDEFTAMNGLLYFQAAGSLWQTDGTAAGTAPVAEVAVFDQPPCRGPFALTVVKDRLYFRTCIPSFQGTDLWRSDGTPAGTVRLQQITVGPVIDRTQAILDDALIFPGSDVEHGVELWRSDGTASGTAILKDISPGTDSSYPAFLRTVNGRVVFQACDAAGCRAWGTDGSESGTRPLADVATTGSFEPAGSLLFFRAGDREHGDELWAIPLAALGPCTDCTPTPTSTPSPSSTPGPGRDGGGCAIAVPSAADGARFPAPLFGLVLLLWRRRR